MQTEENTEFTAPIELDPEAKADYWSKVITEWETSGEKQQAFCESRGISFVQFGYWRKRFGKKSRNKSAMMPVKVIGERGLLNSGIQITLPSGVRCNIPEHCPEKILKQLLNLLGINAC